MNFWGKVKSWVKNGGIYSGILRILQTFIMVIIIYGTTFGIGYNLCHKLILILYSGTNFGASAVPSTIDLALFVGVPLLFIMATLFVFMLLFYKWLWKRMSKHFDLMREKNREEIENDKIKKGGKK